MKSSNDDSLPEIVDIDFLLNTFISIFKISNLYPDAYKKMKLDIINSNCSEEELYLFSAIHLNRNYILVSDKRLSTVKQRKVLNIGVIESMAITSLDQSIGELNATSTMEGDVDALNLIFNYLYYFNNSDINEFDSNKPHVYPVEQIKKIFGVAEILNAVKTGFESAIWKYGLACYSSKLISLIFRDIEKVKLEYAGLMQFKDITFSNLISPPESIKNEAIAIYNKHINKRILDKIEITNGILKFSFLDGDDIFELNEFIYHQIQVSCFYSFISNETFSEQYSCLDTTSCILMFSIISNLLKKIKLEHITPDDSIFNKNDFYKFPIKILIDDVKNILADKTNFKLAQIDAFISILSTDKSNRMNLWETPLVKIDNYFILILMPVCEPVLCRMVDVWLQKGGIPLDKRGHKFELYVKEVLNRILKAKGISFCILNINKFKNRNDEFEEIDLLIRVSSSTFQN